MIKRMLTCIAVVAIMLCTTLTVDAKPLTLNETLEATCRVFVSGSNGKGSQGSGTCVAHEDDKYYVLTNAHVATGTRYARLEFFRDGRKTYPIPATVVWRRLADRTLADFAIIVVEEKYFGKYPPRVIPLVPSNYVIKKEQYIYSAGCPRGAWAVAWEGYVTDKRGNKIIFHPPPIGGQSGSGIFVRYPGVDGELETRLAAILTWRIGSDKVIKDSKGFEKSKGGAIAMNSFYSAVAGRTSLEAVPENYKPVSAKYALGDDGNYYPITYYTDGSKDVTTPPNVRIIEWDVQCGPDGCPPRFPRWQQPPNPNNPRPWQPPTPGVPPAKPPVAPSPNAPANPYGLPDFGKPSESDVQAKALKELNNKLADAAKELVARNDLVKALEGELEDVRLDKDSAQGDAERLEGMLNDAKVDRVQQDEEVELLKANIQQLRMTGENLNKLHDGEVEEKEKVIDDLVIQNNQWIDKLSLKDKELEEEKQMVVNVVWQRNGTFGALALSVLASIGFYLFKWRRPNIKAAMDAVEDKVQDKVASVVGEEYASHLRAVLDSAETKLGNKIEEKLGGFVPNLGSLISDFDGFIKGKLNEVPDGVLNPGEKANLTNDLLGIVTDGLKDLPAEDVEKQAGFFASLKAMVTGKVDTLVSKDAPKE